MAPYKPHTDVVVIADARAPQGKPCTRFTVALTLNDASTEPDLPPEPYGLNPTQRASSERLAEWQRQCATLRANAAAGAPILHKELVVTGPREWRRRHPLMRALSLFALPQWKLTAPLPVTTLPVRYEYAYGGENKVLVTESAARRVGKRYRLPGRAPQAAGAAPDEAIAHTVCEQNPVGRGFAERWYVHARKLARMPAPQIESPQEPISRFGRAYAPQGFGIIGRPWTPRLARAGTYDQRWLDERHPNLPADFDFAYWNGAPADQQVAPHLTGDERFMLRNLCPTDQGTGTDAAGNTLLSFALPGHLPFVLVRFQDGQIGELAARLDTVIVDTAPDANHPDKKPTVVCVWRATAATEPAVRVLEARMLTRDDVAALRAGVERPADAADQHPLTPA